jgi:hypothetical protein
MLKEMLAGDVFAARLRALPRDVPHKVDGQWRIAALDLTRSASISPADSEKDRSNPMTDRSLRRAPLSAGPQERT